MAEYVLCPFFRKEYDEYILCEMCETYFPSPVKNIAAGDGRPAIMQWR